MLSPELSARLRRIAEAEQRSVESVLADIVQAEWVRWATRRRLPAGDW